MTEPRPAPAARQRILLVSTDAPLRHVTAMFLRLSGGYDVLATGSLAEACSRGEGFGARLLLLHLLRGAVPDRAALSRLCADGVPLLCLTTDARPAHAAQLHALGARRVFLVPVAPPHLLACVRELIAA